MKFLLVLNLVLLLTGCTNRDEAYKKAIRPLYESLVKVRGDVKNGTIAPSYSEDCERARTLLDKAHHDFSGDDQARPSFVNMEGALEQYIELRSLSTAPPDKIKLMADGAASDLEKGRVAMEKGE